MSLFPLRLSTPLDRAIVASVAAMAAMNLFVLAERGAAEPHFAAAPATAQVGQA